MQSPPSNEVQIADQNGRVSLPWYRFFAALVSPATAAETINVSGSQVTYVASVDGNVLIHGGTISFITINRGRMALAVNTNASFVPLSQGDSVAVSFSAAPAMTFFPR